MTSEGPFPASSSIDLNDDDIIDLGGPIVSSDVTISKVTRASSSPSSVSVLTTNSTGPASVDKKKMPTMIVPVTMSTSEGKPIREFIRMPGVSNGLTAKLLPKTSNVGPNVTYLGTFVGKDSLSKKVLVAPIKGKDGFTRIILPRNMASATQATPVTSTSTSASPSIPNFSVSVSVANPKGKSIVLSSKTSFDPSSVISSKPNIIRHKASSSILKNASSKQPESTPSSHPVSSRKDLEERIAPPEIVSILNPTDKTDSSNDDKEVTENKSTAAEHPLGKSDEKVDIHSEKDLPVRPEAAPSSDNGESNSMGKPDLVVSTTPSAPLSPVVDRARKRKGQVATTHEPIVKMLPQQQENVKILPGAEEINPFKVLDWNGQGVGVIPESDIKMFVNDYGMLEVHEETLALRGAKLSNRDPKNIYCCLSCNCYGLLQEFFNENFCSIACRDQINAQQQALCLKIEENSPESDSYGDSVGNSKGDDINFESDIIEEEIESRAEGEVNVDGDESNSQSSNSSSSRSTSNRSRLLVKRSPWQQQQLTIGGKQLSRMKAELSHLAKSLLVTTKPSSKLIHGIPNKVAKSGSRLTDAERQKCILAQDLDPGMSLKNEPYKRKEELVMLEKPFPWADYLAHVRGKPAWVKLFNNAFPQGSNNFKIGYKLEAIDPERQSHFCVVTVVDVKGYRIKLHFDNYPKIYDFWVNVDSPNIFPCGFCARHGIQLQPPLGIKKNAFSWGSYNATQKARAAPMLCFPNYRTNNTCCNLFRVGMKLEAVDRKNTFLICVATISGVIDNRVLVHFDTWSDIYDYWVEITSPYIHPIGWSKANNRILTPPNNYKISEFNWEDYLRLTGSIAAPEAAFPLRPPLEFKRGTKLEVVDRRAPHLLRVATVKETLPYQIKITFDGFPDHFGFWTDDDSSDIHPVGWSVKTGHSITFPPNFKEGALEPKTKCSTPCCRGDGHFKGLISETHDKAQDCPYSLENINVENHLTNRLDKVDKRRRKSNNLIGIDGPESASDSDEENKRHRWAFLDARQLETVPQKRVIKEKDVKKLEQAKRTSPVKRKLSEGAKTHVNGNAENVKRVKISERVDKDVMTDPQVKVDSDELCIASDPATWTVKEVVENIRRLVPTAAHAFKREEICGLSLLALSKGDLQTDLELESSKAFEIYTFICSLREQVKAVSFD